METDRADHAKGGSGALRAPISADLIEVVDDEMARVLRAMTPGDRLRVAWGLFESARRMLLACLGSAHPDWEPPRLNAEVAKRLSHAAG
jgi:hypothetical protein